MCGMIGCAGIIGAVAFVIGSIGSLFATEATLFERLSIATMTAAMAFLAALLLFVRDRLRKTIAARQVRNVLEARDDVVDSAFISQFPDVDPDLIAEIRRAIADFFGVAAEKIHPADDLCKDLKFAILEPDFHTSIINQIFTKRKIVSRSFWFHTRGMANIGDLAREVQRVLTEP